jgi:hypothetical protein
MVITLYLFDWNMIFSENRYPLFWIMLQAPTNDEKPCSDGIRAGL